jgi:CheY-like chemotaxis protein
MADAPPVWWIELIKVSPGLLGVSLAIGMVVSYRSQVRQLLERMTKLKGLGIEAEFGEKAMKEAIAAQRVDVSESERRGALKRLHAIATLLRDMRVLWVDDNPGNNRHERALLEDLGVRITTARTSAEGEQALRDNNFTMVITDLNREGSSQEGLSFVARIQARGIYRPTIGYVGTDQSGRGVPAGFFGITNRPDHLMHLICDVVERERL